MASVEGATSEPMKALLIYYSFTGQAQRAVDLASETCRRRNIEPTTCRIDFADTALRLQRPMSVGTIRRWTNAAVAGESFDLTIEPPVALDQRYDFVGLFSNTWMDNPAVPVRSLIESPAWRRLLHDTPFAVYVVCRWLWKRNARIVRERIGSGCRALRASRRRRFEPAGDGTALDVRLR